jgi:CheY-like chemotaxis protein
MRILLAEDNPADVYLLREALDRTEERHIELIVARDGEQAMTYVAGKSALPASALDLVVLDLNLPKSDGSEILRAIRRDDRMDSVPVVILTTSDSPQDRAEAERLGADRYITKPCDLDAFLSLGVELLSHVGRRHKRAGSPS